MTLTNQIKNEIKIHAKEEVPRECCGFILGEIGAHRARNTSQEKNKFKIGDAVSIVEAKPFSKLKRWEVLSK